MKHKFLILISLTSFQLLSAESQTCISSIKATTPSSRFEILPEGVVKDKDTDLLWMRCEYGQTWNGTTCTGEKSVQDWESSYRLINTITFAGRDNWRLPNIKELASISEKACHSPSINLQIFPVSSDKYWSSTPVAFADAEKFAWVYDFKFNRVSITDFDGKLPIRLVSDPLN